MFVDMVAIWMVCEVAVVVIAGVVDADSVVVDEDAEVVDAEDEVVATDAGVVSLVVCSDVRSVG